MTLDDSIVYVVDDDPAICKALSRSLEIYGYHVEVFPSADSFMETYQPKDRPECLILDVRMPGMNGLELQERLSHQWSALPIIFVTGHGDIPMSVRAIKNGAVEFLEKPYLVETLQKHIETALKQSIEMRSKNELRAQMEQRFQTLTARERDVLGLLVAGAANTSNKEIARELDISHRTVDDHRARIMAKMQARSLPELVDMVKICGAYRRND